MQNKTYEEYSAELMAKGYVPMGRYEHTVKRDSIPVLYCWESKTERNLVVLVSTDEMGNADKVIGQYLEQLV